MTTEHAADADPHSRPVPWSLSLYHAGAVVIFFGIFTASLAPYLNTDLWWHLRSGEVIVTSGIPDRDFLSFTAEGQPWLNHEWLAEVVLFQVHRATGIHGLLILVATVVTLTFVIVHLRMRKRGAGPLIALLVLVLAWIASLNSFFLRIQPVTLLFLAVFLLCLDEFRRTGERKVLLPLPLVTLLWANLHGGFAVGLVAVLLILGGEWLEMRMGRSRLSAGDLGALALCFIACVIAGFATPGGMTTFMYPFRFITPNYFTDHINESQRPAFGDPITIAFEILLLGILTAVMLRRRRIPWPDVLLVVAFLHLGLSQLRHMSVFAVAVAPLLGQYLTELFDKRGRPATRITSRPAGLLLPAFHLALPLLSLVLLAAIASQYLTADVLRSVERREYPAAACEFIADGRYGRNVLADYRWGGYILWKLGQPFRTFIDGRADTVFKDDVFRAYLDISGLQPGWKGILGKSGTDLVVIEPDSRLAHALRQTDEWRLIYGDEVAVVFVRSSAPGAD